MLYNIFLDITLCYFLTNFTCKFKIFLWIVFEGSNNGYMKRNFSTIEIGFHSKYFSRIFLPAVMLLVIGFSLRGGYPMVRNYSKQKYNADTQNWDIAQYIDGRMAFANKRGLLLYDGSRWSLYPLENFGAARSVLIDSVAHRTYVGGSWTFGYFEPSDSTGDYHYHSLIPKLPARHAHIGDVWNIFKINNDVYFQGDYDIYKYDGRTVLPIYLGDKILASHVIDGRIYVALKNGRICRYDTGKLTDLSFPHDFSGHTVAAMTDHPLHPGKGLIVTSFDGCFSFDPTSVERFPTDIDSFLKESQVFCADTKDSEVAFGTVNNGLVIKNFKTGSSSYVNKGSGMQNNTVLSVFFDSNSNVWLGLDNGIDFIGHNSPIKLLLPEDESFGAGYASLLYGKTLYYGTNQGLYSISYPVRSGVVPPVPNRELPGQVWGIDSIGNELIISSDLGLFIGKPGSLKEIGRMGGVWNVGKLADGKLLVATYDDYHLVSKKSSGWSDEGRITGFSETNAKVSLDDAGRIWIADWQKGLYSMNLDQTKMRFVNVRHYSTSDGLPVNDNIGLKILDGTAIISTPAGFYRPNPKTGKLQYDSELNERLPFHASAHIYKNSDGSLWGVNGKKIIVHSFSPSGLASSVDSTTFSIAAPRMVPGFDNFNFIDDKIIAGFEDGFYEFNPGYNTTSENSPGVGLARIILNNDSVISGDVLSVRAGKLELPHNLSSVRFEAFLPEYRNEGSVRYSFFLEGYDKEWSSYSEADSKEYTRLGNGDYVLHIRAHNDITGKQSEKMINFSVATPWYWSIWAKIIYLMAFAVIVLLVVRLVLRYSQEKAKKVEATKEKEIILLRQAADESERESRSRIETLQKQKKEDEISHLSESLANVTRNTMHRNEILLRIHGRLDEIKNSIRPENQKGVVLNRKVGEVQQLIDDTLKRDDTLTQVDRNFEGLYGDYVERLKRAYPDLTKMEFRLCCFIKMGLSTKEIAPLMNVAPKSVEMSRYRLRKKLQLERETNLSRFLQEF